MPEQHPYDLPYHWCMSPFHKYVVEEGVRRITPLIEDRVVLDVGCGDGFVSALMASSARRVHGVDLNERAVGFAKMIVRQENASFAVHVAGGVEQAARWFESVDVVTAFEVIEHLEPAERGNFLDGARDVLRASGGWLVLTTPNGRRIRRKNLFHEEELAPDELIDLLHRHRYTDINLQGLYLQPRPEQLEHFANLAPFRAMFRALARAGKHRPSRCRTLVCWARPAVG